MFRVFLYKYIARGPFPGGPCANSTRALLRPRSVDYNIANVFHPAPTVQCWLHVVESWTCARAATTVVVCCLLSASLSRSVVVVCRVIVARRVCSSDCVRGNRNEKWRKMHVKKLRWQIDNAIWKKLIHSLHVNAQRSRWKMLTCMSRNCDDKSATRHDKIES